MGEQPYEAETGLSAVGVSQNIPEPSSDWAHSVGEVDSSRKHHDGRYWPLSLGRPESPNLTGSLLSISSPEDVGSKTKKAEPDVV